MIACPGVRGPLAFYPEELDEAIAAELALED